MPARHILIAQSKGPAAGLAYFEELLARVTKNGTAGLPDTRAIYNELVGAGNRKARFTWYCNRFGSKFPQAMSNAVVEPVEDEDEDDDELLDDEDKGALVVPKTGNTEKELLATIERATALLEALKDNTGHSTRVAPAAKSKTRSTPKAAKNATESTEETQPRTANLWRTWAVEKYNLPTKKGAKFAYTSSRAGGEQTFHQVTSVTDEGIYAIRIEG